MEADKRNYLITYVVKAIKLTNTDYALIENVPALLKLKLVYDSEYRTVLEILKYELILFDIFLKEFFNFKFGKF